MVTIDRNGRFHNPENGRFMSDKDVTDNQLKQVADGYFKDKTGNWHRPDGQFAGKGETEKIREIKTYIKVTDLPSKPISKIPENFDGLIEKGPFVSKKWALYYQCKCRVKQDSPKYIDSTPQDDGSFIIEHYLAISTWKDDFTRRQAIDLHNTRFPSHTLLEIQELKAKVKPEMYYL
jgi:hypothetical protein